METQEKVTLERGCRQTYKRREQNRTEQNRRGWPGAAAQEEMEREGDGSAHRDTTTNDPLLPEKVVDLLLQLLACKSLLWLDRRLTLHYQ